MKKVLAITIFLILCICINTVYATDVSVTLNKQVTEIKKGEELAVDVKIDNVNSEKGVDTLIATLNYDSNIFEKVEKANISSQNDWNSPSFRADNGKIIIQRDEPMKVNGTVFSITLKAKEGAILGDSTIKLSDINLSEGTENYFPSNVETTIYIKDVLGNNEQENDRPEDNTTPTPTVKPTTKPEATQKPIDNTVKPTTKPTQSIHNNVKPTVLPKAGDGVNVLVIIPVLLVITVLAYIQIRKYRGI